MLIKIHARQFILSFFVAVAFSVNSIPLFAQDVVTSDDISGGFVFKVSSKASQKKTTYQSATNIKRSKVQRVVTTKKIRAQTAKVIKESPNRKKFKEVNPTTINQIELKRKPKEEVSRIFAGAGEYYLASNNAEKAAEFFEEATILDEANKEAELGLSEALTLKADGFIEKEQPEYAKPLYERATRLNPKNAAALAGLGNTYELMDDKDKAFEYYSKALAIDPKLTELYTPIGINYFEKGNIAEADLYLTKALTVSADNAETQLFLGLVRFKQNKINEAITAFRRAIQLDPTSAEAHYFLGELYERQNQPDDAITEYLEATRINPRYTAAWFDLGVAYYNREKYQQAVDAYTQVIKLKNDYGEAHANLADTYRQMGALDRALGEYRLATAFLKNDAELYSKYGYVAARYAVDPSRRSLWNTAIENLTKAVNLSSDYSDYSNLGWAYYNAANSDLRDRQAAAAKIKFEKAKENFQQAIRLDNSSPAPYLNLGMVLTDLEDYQGAIDALKRANELRKDWVPALNELGIAYRKNGDFKNAIKQFRRVIEIDSKFASSIYNLGESEFRNGNIPEAKKAHQRLKQLKRNDLATQLEIATSGAVIRQ